MSDLLERMTCTPELEDEDEEEDELEELEEERSASPSSLIPANSRKVYDSAYEKYLKWAKENNVEGYYSESALLEYFTHLSEKVKSSTLWAQYSMIKCLIFVKHNINIQNYTKLISFIKRQSEGYKPEKAKVLTKLQYFAFLNNAPNERFLAAKANYISKLYEVKLKIT